MASTSVCQVLSTLFTQAILFKRNQRQNSTSNLPLAAHCIDSIRLSLQCHADTSVIPFTWLPNYKLPWPDFRSTHKCRNFDDILAFAQENFFDAEKHKDLFVHPELGEYTGGATGDPTEQGKQGSAAWEPREGESS